MAPKIAVLIPTYNASELWEQVLQSIIKQSIKIDKLLIVDSGSSDRTVFLAKAYGAEVLSIPKEQFLHGYARHLLISHCPEVDHYVFLTQDAVLESEHSIAELIKPLFNPSVGAAYGRQLPHPGAQIIEAHNRYFNYPERSFMRSKDDIGGCGFKTIFCSNSFAVYKKEAYFNGGGFPLEANFGEDSILVARMILSGWKVAYVAEAKVYHSHHLSVLTEYKRYFEIGKFHKQNPWLYEKFGEPGREGIRYLISELKYCFKRNPLLVLAVFIKCFNKFIGYKVGLRAPVNTVNYAPNIDQVIILKGKEAA